MPKGTSGLYDWRCLIPIRSFLTKWKGYLPGISMLEPNTIKDSKVWAVYAILWPNLPNKTQDHRDSMRDRSTVRKFHTSGDGGTLPTWSPQDILEVGENLANES